MYLCSGDPRHRRPHHCKAARVHADRTNERAASLEGRLFGWQHRSARCSQEPPRCKLPSKRKRASLPILVILVPKIHPLTPYRSKRNVPSRASHQIQIRESLQSRPTLPTLAPRNVPSRASHQIQIQESLQSRPTLPLRRRSRRDQGPVLIPVRNLSAGLLAPRTTNAYR